MTRFFDEYQSPHIRTLNKESDWFLVQTNYDETTPIEKRDKRRIPAERNTKYKILKRFDGTDEKDEELDKIKDVSQFGSYVELIKIDKYKYKNPRNE